MMQALAWSAPQPIPAAATLSPSTISSSSCLFSTCPPLKTLSLTRSTDSSCLPLRNASRRNGHPRRREVACVCTLTTAAPESLEDEELSSSPSPSRPKHQKSSSSVRQLILKPPLSDNSLAERFLESPQLQLRSYPVLSSCLPLQTLRQEDQEWMDGLLLEVKDALGYGLEVPSEETREDNSATHLDSLLFLAFNHSLTDRGKTKWVGIGHSRLCFLGQHVIELAFCELLLQMYPRERVGPMRERVFNLTSRKVLSYWFRKASLDHVLFPTEELEALKGHEKQVACRDVFRALVAAVYLALGMPEVYRLLFEVFGMDLDAPTAQPRDRSSLPDEDFVSPDLDPQKSWQDIVSYRVANDALFTSPLLFRACVPPGMHRFRRNVWEISSLPTVRQMLGYPRTVTGSSKESTDARNVELDLGLQLCFLHPSKYKGVHPRFCFDRLEYLGSKIKDVIGAEQILMTHLDGPAKWLDSKHRQQFINRVAGRTLRDKKLHYHIIYDEERKEQFERNRRLRNFATTSVQHAIHGLGYMIYGRSEVRRLMYKVFALDELVPAKFL